MSFRIAFLFAFVVSALASGASAAAQPQRYYGKIAKRLGDMLPKYR